MLTYFGKSDIGKKRTTNQDAFNITELAPEVLLCVVCDGMGGSLGGSEASSMAINLFVSVVKEHIEHDIHDGQLTVTGDEIVNVLTAAAIAANDAVYKKSSEEAELSGMGTTLTAALLYENSIYIANIGDSRVYLSGDEHIEQITHDHSYVQYLVDIGMLTQNEAKTAPNRNIITRAIGIEATVEPDITTVAMPKGERAHLLLCSDGLCGTLDEGELQEIISRDVPLEETSAKLIDAANERGGNDNITAVLVRF